MAEERDCRSSARGGQSRGCGFKSYPGGSGGIHFSQTVGRPPSGGRCGRIQREADDALHSPNVTPAFAVSTEDQIAASGSTTPATGRD